MLTSYLKDRGHAKWAQALNEIQQQKNSRFHRVIGMSPYEALFGKPLRHGLESLGLPADALEGLETEEDVLALIDATDVESGARSSDDESSDADEAQEGIVAHHGFRPVADSPEGILADLTHAATAAPLPDTCKACEMPVPAQETCLCAVCKAVLHWNCGFPVANTDTLLCALCHGKARMVRNRKEAHNGQVAAAVSMKEKTSSLLDPINVGDNVLVAVPQVDRGPADPPNIMGIVLAIQNDVYQVGTRAGLLKVS